MSVFISLAVTNRFACDGNHVAGTRAAEEFSVFIPALHCGGFVCVLSYILAFFLVVSPRLLCCLYSVLACLVDLSSCIFVLVFCCCTMVVALVYGRA